MSLTNLAQQLAVIETTHGMDLLADYVSWIESDGIATVAAVSGRRKSMVKKYHRVYTVLSAAAVQTAIRKANLSFNVILELGSAGVERVRLFVCGGDFLEVFVEAVRVGDSHLVDGLFPSGDFPAFDKAAS